MVVEHDYHLKQGVWQCDPPLELCILENQLKYRYLYTYHLTSETLVTFAASSLKAALRKKHSLYPYRELQYPLNLVMCFFFIFNRIFVNGTNIRMSSVCDSHGQSSFPIIGPLFGSRQAVYFVAWHDRVIQLSAGWSDTVGAHVFVIVVVTLAHSKHIFLSKEMETLCVSPWQNTPFDES